MRVSVTLALTMALSACDKRLSSSTDSTFASYIGERVDIGSCKYQLTSTVCYVNPSKKPWLIEVSHFGYQNEFYYQKSQLKTPCYRNGEFQNCKQFETYTKQTDTSNCSNMPTVLYKLWDECIIRDPQK